MRLSLGDDHDGGYAREAIDTINQFLMENTRRFVMVLAGYKDDIEKTFLNLKNNKKISNYMRRLNPPRTATEGPPVRFCPVDL